MFAVAAKDCPVLLMMSNLKSSGGNCKLASVRYLAVVAASSKNTSSSEDAGGSTESSPYPKFVPDWSQIGTRLVPDWYQIVTRYAYLCVFM